MVRLVKSIDFHNVPSNQMQTKLTKDIHAIRHDETMPVPADKTTNFYKLETASYNKLLEDNTTKTYKLAPPNSERAITTKDKTHRSST